ncbi:MAG TPA: MmcQ/YjbR family DNA-binding protein [Acidimicrobiales bacterium]|nr:MmcQ/YjbR family DNA-binding protein [Acidimicrobiales bacterium]
MATFDDVIRLTAHLPEVTESTSFATPALKVRGKAFCRLWGERDQKKADVGGADVLVVFCDIDEKQFLLAENEGAVFTAPHYDGHGSVLVLLDEVDETLLSNLLFDSYLLKAPPSIQRQFPPG